MPLVRDPSAAAVEVGRRWIWVGWERMLTDFESVDREFASAGISSSNSSTCASRSYPDFAAIFRRDSREQIRKKGDGKGCPPPEVSLVAFRSLRSLVS